MDDRAQPPEFQFTIKSLLAVTCVAEGMEGMEGEGMGSELE